MACTGSSVQTIEAFWTRISPQVQLPATNHQQYVCNYNTAQTSGNMETAQAATPIFNSHYQLLSSRTKHISSLGDLCITLQNVATEITGWPCPWFQATSDFAQHQV